jgi:hypothetical protein
MYALLDPTVERPTMEDHNVEDLRFSLEMLHSCDFTGCYNSNPVRLPDVIERQRHSSGARFKCYVSLTGLSHCHLVCFNQLWI